jgi:uncharacterized protein (TIGR00369 family)
MPNVIKTLNPDWIDRVRRQANPCPYFELLQMQIVDLEWGRACLDIAVDRRHLQPFGIVHGGVYASIIDAAGFWAVFSQADPELGMTTVELKLNYLAPTDSGRLIARGKCLKLGRSLGLGEASVEDASGRLLAHGTTTLMVQPNRTLDRQTDFPDKYL